VKKVTLAVSIKLNSEAFHLIDSLTFAF